MKHLFYFFCAILALSVLVTSCNKSVKKTSTPDSNSVKFTQIDDTEKARNYTFVLKDGKLGSLFIGMRKSEIPESVEGLYDKREFVKETFEEDEMYEGEPTKYTVESCNFYKEGKKIFSASLDRNKLSSITLEEGSSFIQTEEGVYVGFLARDLFKMKPKASEWDCYMDVGKTYANGREKNRKYHYMYEVSEFVELPYKASDFKPTAKIISIWYSKN